MHINSMEQTPLSMEYIADRDVGLVLNEELCALFSTCFTGPNDERFKRQRYYSEMPQHRWLIREPGLVIAHVAMHEKQIGTVAGEFTIGGVAEVAVHPDYRGRGLAKQVLSAANAAFAERGVQFSFLFGRPNVYGSSGYVPVMNPLRHYDTVSCEWFVRKLDFAMVKMLGATPWPEGEIDLRGPVF